MIYKPFWNSLNKHNVPAWFKDAKFGIYTHWGIYSVPAKGPNGSWYPYHMYQKGTGQYAYHTKTYGRPSGFGYKDFIPMLTGKKFDPDEWARLFKKAGAEFAGPVGMHHDGFAMWDSRITKWNAANMGPKRDIVGCLEKSIRKTGMKFMVAMHHAENWYFFPHWEKSFDTSDPRYTGLYGDLHNTGKPPKKINDWNLQEKPNRKFHDKWLNILKEVTDNYKPDMLWFDFGIRHINDFFRRKYFAYYYNMAEKLKREVIVTYKYHDIPPNSAVNDIELGRLNEIAYHHWLTDTTVDDGQGWGYLKDAKYKEPSTLIHYLADNVSKNGRLLLNIGPNPDGEIPLEAKNILLEIGKWLEINGEAIYGTNPWTEYGEGPAKMLKTGPFCEDKDVKYSAKDLRFTVKDNTLYVICLGCPKEKIIITKGLKWVSKDEIKTVRALGSKEKLSWKMGRDCFLIEPPRIKPCEHANVFKIERKCPF